jgi:hypothetical protein
VIPDPADPDTLATLRPAKHQQPDDRTLAEVDAALRRRGDTSPFARQEVAADTIETLRASDPRARVDFPSGEDQRIDLAVAVSWADRVEHEDTACQAEMKRWLHDPDVHAMVDGVPVDGIPPRSRCMSCGR